MKLTNAVRSAAIASPRPSNVPFAVSILALTLAVPLATTSAQHSQNLSIQDPGSAARDAGQRGEGLLQNQRGEAPRNERAENLKTRRQKQPQKSAERREGRRENRADRREERQERRGGHAERREERKEQRRNARQELQQEQRKEHAERHENRNERRNARQKQLEENRQERHEDHAKRRDNRGKAGQTEGRDRFLSEIKRTRTSRRENDGREVIAERGDRRIVRENNRAFIQHDEGERFRRLDRSRVDRREGRDGRNIITVDRPNGVRIISVYDRNGHLIERRRRRNGRETVLINNKRFWAGVAAGAAISALTVTLGEPRIDIPRRDYIVEYGSASDDDLYEALSARPLETFDHGYALEQIRYSHDLRQRLRRVDLTEITFESGSWEVGPDQARKLDRLARTMKRILDRNPDEIFLIEGHTDAVGSEIDNLSLSDRRAESVAVVLTEKYGIPPENLVTQGYGEQYLAVETNDDEPRNRRVAVRRITPLLASR